MRATTLWPDGGRNGALILAILIASGCGGSDGGDPTDPGADEPTQLMVGPIGAQIAGVPFDVTVTLADADGRAVPPPPRFRSPWRSRRATASWAAS